MKKTDVLKTLIFPCLLLNGNITFYKNKAESKIPHTLLERRTLCFPSYKNHELSAKLCWVGALERKKSAFFKTFILPDGLFFNICFFISMYSVLNKPSEYVYFYVSKTLFHMPFCLFFKIVESLQCNLKK